MKLSTDFKIIISVFIVWIFIFLIPYFLLESGFVFHFLPDGFNRFVLQQSCSPCSTYKLVLVHENGGQIIRGKDFNYIYILEHDINTKIMKWRNEKPILLTDPGNVESFSWIDNTNVLIRVKSRELIHSRLRNYNDINIIIEIVETEEEKNEYRF